MCCRGHVFADNIIGKASVGTMCTSQFSAGVNMVNT